MATVIVSLPEPMTDWIDEQVGACHYASPSDYVGDLVRQDRERKDKLAALRQMIDDAEAGGLSARSLDEIFAEARATADQPGR